MKNHQYVYMKLDGTPLPFQPYEEIARANQLNKKFDYRAYDETAQVGIAELWGRREFQEDRVVSGIAEGFEKLSDEEAKTVLLSVIKNLQTQIARENLPSGATFCLSVFSKNKVFTASVGDSTAFLIQLKKSGEINSERLNKLLHNPEFEMERLNPQHVRYQRLGGQLLLSRALGDIEYEPLGLLHVPDQIYIDSVPFKKDERFFLVVACDGLTESSCLETADIGDIIKEMQHEKVDRIATVLAKAALKFGSHDNISVLITELFPDEKPKYLGVFDGHGGDEVSSFLYQNFEEILHQSITQIK